MTLNQTKGIIFAGKSPLILPYLCCFSLIPPWKWVPNEPRKKQLTFYHTASWIGILTMAYYNHNKNRVVSCPIYPKQPRCFFPLLKWSTPFLSVLRIRSFCLLYLYCCHISIWWTSDHQGTGSSYQPQFVSFKKLPTTPGPRRFESSKWWQNRWEITTL